MDFSKIIIKNIFSLPLLLFFLGMILKAGWKKVSVPGSIERVLSFTLLFLVGFKGGLTSLSLIYESNTIIQLALMLILGGIFVPFIGFYFLGKFTDLDRPTAAALSGTFGSISIITFATAISFLEHLGISYHQSLLSLVVLLEVPGIIAAILLSNFFSEEKKYRALEFVQGLKKILFCRAILALLMGLLVGYFISKTANAAVNSSATKLFYPLLCLFLFTMGTRVQFPKAKRSPLSSGIMLFGIYMPLLGATIGIAIGYVLRLDPGSTCLIAVLSGSASYIAVPAAARIVLPKANESIYLPVALGITFPFNLMIGIPLYYYIATMII